MSKTVKFNVEGFGKEFTLIDTMANVEKASKGLERTYKAMDKVEKEKGDSLRLVDYSDVLRPVLIENVAEILGLNKTDAKKLEDVSYSDLEDFYKEICMEFVGLELPTLSMIVSALNGSANQATDSEETEDPKSNEEG